MEYLLFRFSLLFLFSVCHGESGACKEVSCDRECRSHASKLDRHGCPTCECWIDHCPKFKCRPCPNYYKYRDIDGHMCQGCECVNNIQCPPLECECMRGYRPGRDINNCETCNCVPDDTPRCPIEYYNILDSIPVLDSIPHDGCPPRSTQITAINGVDEICCKTYPSTSDKPTCASPDAEPLDVSVAHCGGVRGDECPEGYHCSVHEAGQWAVCCPHQGNTSKLIHQV